MSGFTDILASIAVHAVIIGAAVSVIRDEPPNLERSIEIPISFEIVEASYMPSSPASSSEEKEQIEPEPQDSEDEALEPEEAEEVEPVEDETNVPAPEPDFEKSDIELIDALIESLPPKASPMQDLVPDSEPPQMSDAEKEESTLEPPSPLVEQGVETAQQQEERAEVVSVPSATGRIVPVYPRRARRKGHEGVVTVEISVGADGKVDDVSVVASSGHPELDDAAVAAVRTASFAPATVGGVGVSGKLRLTFDFRLK